MKKSRAPRRKRKQKPSRARTGQLKAGLERSGLGQTGGVAVARTEGEGKRTEELISSTGQNEIAGEMVSDGDIAVSGSGADVARKGRAGFFSRALKAGEKGEKIEKKSQPSPSPKEASPESPQGRVKSGVSSGISSGVSFIGGPVRVVGRWFEFIRQVRSETLRVIWPTRNETLITTIMVFIIVTLAALFFLGADQVLSFSVAWIFRNLSL